MIANKEGCDILAISSETTERVKNEVIQNISNPPRHEMGGVRIIL